MLVVAVVAVELVVVAAVVAVVVGRDSVVNCAVLSAAPPAVAVAEL